MAHQRFLVQALTPWLAEIGAKPGDILVDRGTLTHRYMLTRPMGEPEAVVSGLQEAGAKGCLHPVDGPLVPGDRVRGHLRVLD